MVCRSRVQPPFWEERRRDKRGQRKSSLICLGKREIDEKGFQKSQNLIKGKASLTINMQFVQHNSKKTSELSIHFVFPCSATLKIQQK